MNHPRIRPNHSHSGAIIREERESDEQNKRPPSLRRGACPGRWGRSGDVQDAAGIGSEVVLWGRSASGAVLSADEVAHAAGTISYELTCAVAPRVPFAVD